MMKGSDMKRKLMLIAALALVLSVLFVFGDQVIPEIFMLWDTAVIIIRTEGEESIAATEMYVTSELRDDVIAANDAFVKLGKERIRCSLLRSHPISNRRFARTLNRPVFPQLDG